MIGGRNDVLRDFAKIVLRYGKNLTAHRDWDTLWCESVLDSLLGWQVFTQMYGGKVQTIVDVGSGAGFPGMVIAIAYPHITVHLVDSRKKAVSFLDFAAVQLGIQNVRIHWCPFQRLAVSGVDVLTVRAVAPMGELCEIITNSPTEWKVAALWKGPNWKDEISDRMRCEVVSARMYNVPGSGKQRFIVMVRDSG